MSSAARTSSSDVEVTGIGSDASVTAAGTSTFDVLISTVDDVLPESTATANGAAGANLSTSSFANQSQASTASAFMQAFGGNQVGFVETDTTMGTSTGTGTVGDDISIESQVYQVFNDVLGIDPDANGLAYWTNELETGMDLDTFADTLANAK